MDNLFGKKKKSKKKIVVIGITILLLLAIGVILLQKKGISLDNDWFGTKMKFPSFATKVENNEDKKSGEEPQIKTYKTSLLAGGDALLHSVVHQAGYDSKTNTYDYKYMFELIQDKINKYDIKYYNQEVIFDDDKPYSSYPLFNAPSAWGKSMIEEIGFNMISLATNHSMDVGNNSAKKYAKWWEEKEEVLTHGMASSEEKREEYNVFESNGIRYTMLSYTYGTNGIPVPEDYVVNVFDKEKALEDIKNVRDQVDVLIVAMHWGEEYNTGVTKEQREQAKFLGENGVDIILGNHPHSIEPFEWIDEDTVVFYAFGNLISAQMTAQNPKIRKLGSIGYLGTMDITKTVDEENNTSSINIDNLGAELIFTTRFYNNQKSKYDYKIIPFSHMNENYLANYKAIYNEMVGIITSLDKNITIEPVNE